MYSNANAKSGIGRGGVDWERARRYCDDLRSRMGALRVVDCSIQLLERNWSDPAAVRNVAIRCVSVENPEVRYV